MKENSPIKIPGASDKAEEKRLSHSWEAKLDQALLAAVESPVFQGMESLADILWTHGILDRIMPQDPQVRGARKTLRKTLFQEEDLSQLYRRIFYSAHATRYAFEQGHSCGPSSSYVEGAVLGIQHLMRHQAYAKMYREKGRLPQVQAMDLIMERANSEYAKVCGSEKELRTLRVGQKGTINGIRVCIERFCGDGSLWLKAEKTEEIAPLIDLMEENEGLTGFPSELFIPDEETQG
jgi:hypothetical protein